jgi:hypothetical protein
MSWIISHRFEENVIKYDIDRNGPRTPTEGNTGGVRHQQKPGVHNTNIPRSGVHILVALLWFIN